MALAQAQQNHTLLASSEDGYTFTLMDMIIDVGGIPELAVMPDGQVRLYLQYSLISDDNGQSWIEEPVRFVPGPDPSLVAMPDGTYTMFYKKFANQPENNPDNPPPKNTIVRDFWSSVAERA